MGVAAMLAQASAVVPVGVLQGGGFELLGVTLLPVPLLISVGKSPMILAARLSSVWVTNAANRGNVEGFGWVARHSAATAQQALDCCTEHSRPQRHLADRRQPDLSAPYRRRSCPLDSLQPGNDLPQVLWVDAARA